MAWSPFSLSTPRPRVGNNIVCLGMLDTVVLLACWLCTNMPAPGLQQQFNHAMVPLHVAVEWSFCLVIRYFSALDCVPHQNIFLTAPGAMYRVAVVLTNLRTCFIGQHQISQTFNLQPPSVGQYLMSVSRPPV